MDIKHKEVVDWLQEVYGEEQIPPYEKTECSITILHQLMTASKCSDEKANLLAADFITKTQEYDAEARQLKRWLDPLGITPDMLCDDGQTRLSALAHLAEALDVQIPTCTNVFLAANELEMTHMEVLGKRKYEQIQTRHLLEMSQKISKKLEEIRGIQQQAEMTWQNQQEEHMRNVKQEEFMKVKCDNYLADITNYEAKLNKIGMTSSITHQALGTQWEDLEKLEKQVTQLEDQLKSYTLPPDLVLAQVEVEAARQELASIMKSMAAACKNTNCG